MKMMRVMFEFPRLEGAGANTYKLHSITSMIVYPEKVRIEFANRPSREFSLDIMRRIKFIEEYDEEV